MNDNDLVRRSIGERASECALVVLGMHRSGTSAIAGALRLCGAWVGEESELTGANVENPKGFWERRDIRQICDRLLHSAGADWWKLASFELDAIPHAILTEERRRFQKIVSKLNEHKTWIIKEPRLCLLLPALCDYVENPVCIHIFRNPLEVARSLKKRSGFSISAGLALWEAYNVHALNSCRQLPHILISHSSLMIHPVETINRLYEQLEELSVPQLLKPDRKLVEQFIDPNLYRQKVACNETKDYLSSSQKTLWTQLCSGETGYERAFVSPVTKQYLFDLESTQTSFRHYEERIVDLRGRVVDLRGQVVAREERIGELRNQVTAREERIRELHASLCWKVMRSFRWLSKRIRRFRRVFSPSFRFGAKRSPRVEDRKTARRKTAMAEDLFRREDFHKSLSSWRELYADYPHDEALSGHARLMISVLDRLLHIDRYKNLIDVYKKGTNEISREDRKLKIAVYTAIVGDCDSIKLPHILDRRLEYFLFTDSPKPRSHVWNVRAITYVHEDNARSARFVKTHPHMLLDDFDIAIWIDSNIMILDDIYAIIESFLSSGATIAAIPHPIRKSIYEEYDSCVNRKKDESMIMHEQISNYRKEGFNHDDLIESNFMMFDVREETTLNFLDSWWKEIDCHSKRDQLSLNYTLSRIGLDWYRLVDHPDSIRNHTQFAFVPHDKGKGPNTRLIEALGMPTIDPYDGLPYAQIKHQRINEQKEREIDIVVCVHNALNYVQQCLESILRTRNSPHQKLIIIDDGSHEPTRKYLERFSASVSWCELHRNDRAGGYPKAANRGLSVSTGELVILLNSDTVVTTGWLEKLADAVFSTSGAGIVGAMSNAASYQSIPEYTGRGGQTAVNTLPPGLTPEDMNRYCEKWTVAHLLPRVPLVHGFCFGIVRSVIDRIGLFDEVSFPRGYGEENDYCFRAADSGFGLVVATHTYIYHAKSQSYADEERVTLMKSASETFRKKYGRNRIKRATLSMAENPFLADLRVRAKKLATKIKTRRSQLPDKMRY